MPRGTAINSNTYCRVLQDLRTAIWCKQSRWQCKFVLVLRDNARAHSVIKMQNFWQQFGWTVFEHPMYNPNLAPNDYHLFQELKKCLSGQHFVDDTALIIFVNSFLRKTLLEFYDSGICKLVSRYKECLEHQGDFKILKYFSKFEFN